MVNLEEVDGEFLGQRVFELLRHIVEGIQNHFFGESQQELLLKIQISLFGDRQQLLEEHDNEFDHLLVLLGLLLDLQALSQVAHQCADDFGRQERLLVGGQLPHYFNSQGVMAVQGGQICHFDEYHQGQKGEFLVLIMEDDQGQQVFLDKVPLTESVVHNRIPRGVRLEALENVFDGLLTKVSLDVDIEAGYIFDGANSLHVVEQLFFECTSLLVVHTFCLLISRVLIDIHLEVIAFLGVVTSFLCDYWL